MIAGWLVKLLVSFAMLGVAGFELGSPLLTKAQVDDVAHSAADDAARTYFDTRDPDAARAEAEKIVADKVGMTLTAFDLDENGKVYVTVYKRAKSIVLDRLSQADDWYDVSVSAEAISPFATPR